MVYASISIGFSALFLTILLSVHFLKPELDPSWRMISEYEIGRHGWMMRLAFFCWGASVAALLITIWPSLSSTGGIISRWWLIVIVIALVGAGIFKTNPITDTTPNLVNTIHTLCGTIVILTFPIATTLAATSLLTIGSWWAGKGWLIAATVLVWVGLVAYLGITIISVIKDPTAGRGGPHVYSGWPNRFLAVAYITWLVIVAGVALRIG